MQVEGGCLITGCLGLGNDSSQELCPADKQLEAFIRITCKRAVHSGFGLAKSLKPQAAIESGVFLNLACKLGSWDPVIESEPVTVLRD